MKISLDTMNEPEPFNGFSDFPKKALIIVPIKSIIMALQEQKISGSFF